MCFKIHIHSGYNFQEKNKGGVRCDYRGLLTSGQRVPPAGPTGYVTPKMPRRFWGKRVWQGGKNNFSEMTLKVTLFLREGIFRLRNI